MHDDELAIDAGLVRALVRRDVPRWGDLSVTRIAASGSTNVLFRLGDEYVVRLPRQLDGSASIVTEARWVARLAPALPVRVPEIVAVGEPGFGYPARWSLARWLDGDVPSVPVPDDAGAVALAQDLAGVVAALRAVPVPADAAADPALRGYRGGPLHAIDADIRGYLDRCGGLPGLALDLDACREVWSAAVALPSSPGPERWVHADLVGENLLVRDGRLHAVLDFGALAVGDPSVDLVAAWDVLGPRARTVFRETLDVDDVTWQRGRAWALALAVMTLPYYWHSLPARCASRVVMARQVVAAAAGSRGD